MIVPNQQNLKVHYASGENPWHVMIWKNAGVKYNLFSVYRWICNKLEAGKKPTFTEQPKLVTQYARHTIMDSGLFTLMFGSEKGQKSVAMLERWCDLILEFMAMHNYQDTYVEVDCQKVLGVEQAWVFREKMKAASKNRQINVFHVEDGQKGLDRLIEFSDYIALSLPELRILKKKDHTVRLANYIKNRKPTIDIHLLGCTEFAILKECNFCTSADSTSWLTSGRFGMYAMNDGRKVHRKGFDERKVRDRYYEQLKADSVKHNLNLTEKGAVTNALAIMQCKTLRKMYEDQAGSQQ